METKALQKATETHAMVPKWNNPQQIGRFPAVFHRRNRLRTRRRGSYAQDVKKVVQKCAHNDFSKKKYSGTLVLKTGINHKI